MVAQMSFLSGLFGTPPAPAAALASLDFAAAIKAAAPQADLNTWLVPIIAAFGKYEINTPHRVAAALGQAAVEAGPAFAEISEDLNYTHADRICAVFPAEFTSVAIAQGYCGNPQALANRAYAGKLGNGPEASGDGWLFRGRGLIQITGRDAYTALGMSVGMSPEDAAVYAATPEGAAASLGWYWTTNGLSELADGWQLSAITRRVNGAAMLGSADRIAASNAALAALGVS